MIHLAEGQPGIQERGVPGDVFGGFSELGFDFGVELFSNAVDFGLVEVIVQGQGDDDEFFSFDLEGASFRRDGGYLDIQLRFLHFRYGWRPQRYRSARMFR